MSVNDPPGSGPYITICPTVGCYETEDLLIQECAPGHTWMFTGGACGHWGFIARKTNESERDDD